MLQAVQFAQDLIQGFLGRGPADVGTRARAQALRDVASRAGSAGRRPIGPAPGHRCWPPGTRPPPELDWIMLLTALPPAPPTPTNGASRCQLALHLRYVQVQGHASPPLASLCWPSMPALPAVLSQSGRDVRSQLTHSKMLPKPILPEAADQAAAASSGFGLCVLSSRGAVLIGGDGVGQQSGAGRKGRAAGRLGQAAYREPAARSGPACPESGLPDRARLAVGWRHRYSTTRRPASLSMPLISRRLRTSSNVSSSRGWMIPVSSDCGTWTGSGCCRPRRPAAPR